MKWLDQIAYALLIIGGINYALAGIYGLDGIGLIFGGSDSIPARLTFTMIGVAAVYEIVEARQILKRLPRDMEYG
ncbi:DUF378 domain-containing protein [Poriferisphaera sp. WC338]|uniref:DUF378 domain-containing protein n=1 Tax=Poriferisphaera sp. WC338 TaxID=3425129 RepID=UPI003D813F5F